MDVKVGSTGAQPSDFIGFSPLKDVSGITFTNFRQNGALALNLPAAQIDLGPFVSNVVFQQQ